MSPPRFISFTSKASPSRDRARRTISMHGSLEPPAFERSMTVPTMDSLGYGEGFHQTLRVQGFSSPSDDMVAEPPSFRRSVTLDSLTAPVRPQRKKSIEYISNDDSDYSTDGERSKSRRNYVWTTRVTPTKQERVRGDATPPRPTRRSSNHMDEGTDKFSQSSHYLKRNMMPTKPLRRASTFTSEAA